MDLLVGFWMGGSVMAVVWAMSARRNASVVDYHRARMERDRD